MLEESDYQKRKRLHSTGELQILSSRDGEYVVYFLHGEELDSCDAVEYYDEAKGEWIEGEFFYPDEDTPIPTIFTCYMETIPAISTKLRFDWEIIEMDY